VGVVFVRARLEPHLGGGKIAGTARWFTSWACGRDHPRLDGSLTEVGGGVLLLVGFATPLAAAASSASCSSPGSRTIGETASLSSAR